MRNVAVGVVVLPSVKVTPSNPSHWVNTKPSYSYALMVTVSPGA